MKGAAILPALERLCSSKNVVQLTPHASETWVAALSVFDRKIVNEVILKIALSDDPFPDLGKIVTRCDALRRERTGTVGQGEVKLGTKTLKSLAAAWQLEIE